MQQVVIKFGGTSVSTRATWNNIAAITQKHLNTGVQPVIVCSALTQISNKLEKAIEAALLDEHHSLFNDIQSSHLNLAEQLEVNHQLIANDLHQLQQWLTGISLLKQAPAKTHAQILSLGELMMTRLGHAFLEKQGIKVKWYDARELLTSTPTLGGETMNYLSARCESEYDSALVKNFSPVGLKPLLPKVFLLPILMVKPFCLVEEALILQQHYLRENYRPLLVKYGLMSQAFIPPTRINYPTPDY